MRTIKWQVVIGDNNQIAIMENTVGFQNEQIESHLTIIGLLENLKQKHLEKINTLYHKTETVKSGEDKSSDL